MRLTPFALAFAALVSSPPSAPAAPSSPQAQEFAAAAKPAIADLKSEVADAVAEFTADLDARLGAIDESNLVNAPFQIVDGVRASWAELAGDLRDAGLIFAYDLLDRAASRILADAGLESAPGMQPGDGGAVDKAVAASDKIMAAAVRKCAAFTRKRAARLLAGRSEYVFTVRAFPPVLGEYDISPGGDPDRVTPSFATFAPVVVTGCGNEVAFGIAFVSYADYTDQDVTVQNYEADGSGLNVFAVARPDGRSVLSVTGADTRTRHGVTILEVYRPNVGWTRAIGY